MAALQGGSGGRVSWVHQDPVTKSQRVTNSSGTVVSTIDLDPCGGDAMPGCMRGNLYHVTLDRSYDYAQVDPSRAPS